MAKFTNVDTQIRFRRKEQLKREADKIYRLWEGSPGRWRSKRTPEEVRHALDKAVELPVGWTDEDYQYAAKMLGQYHLDLISSVDQIANDIDGDRNTHVHEFMTSGDPMQFFRDNKAAIENAWALASHIISALKLSKCNAADQAAALMEAIRFVARSLVSNPEIHCSAATATCLANIGPQYDRPDWFVKKFAETIRQQIGNELAQQLGQDLSRPYKSAIQEV